MLDIEKKRYIFKTKEIWFSDYPFEVGGCDLAVFYACKNKIDVGGFDREDSTTLVIDLTQDLDKIWNNMGKSSCRYTINIAKKNNIKVIINQKTEDFLKINISFRNQKGMPMSVLTPGFIKKYGVLFVAELDGEVLGGQFYLKDSDNMRLLISASKRLSVSKEKAILVGAGNRLMIWEAIKYAKANRLKCFDFGGYYMGTEDKEWIRVNKFKESFGGKLVTYYIYKKNYSKIYKILKEVYRLLLYKH